MPDPRSTGRRRLAAFALALVPAAAAFVAYRDVGTFGFVFDDDNALVTNEALRAGDPFGAAFGAYTSLANRLLACVSFALDFRLGLGPGAMHVHSLALHAANALLVAAVVAAALRAPNLAPRTAGIAPPVAIASAALWAVHPLSADAVAYLTQRSMLLMACFALLALLAVLRAHASPRKRRWQTTAVAATALAMASKEECAALPLLLVLAERAFCAPTWSALRARRRFHAALAATWSVLAICVALGPANPTVGYRTIPPVTAFEWLVTQTQVLWLYVRAVFVPSDLRGMYDVAVVRDLGPAALPGLALLAVLAATALAFRRRPWIGFAGAWFFLLLAPTSSVLPIVTEPCADRRMYLPLLSFVVPLAVAARLRLGARTFCVAAAATAALLAWRTSAVAATYRDQATFVTHAAASNELANGSFLAGRILASHARVLHEAGRTAEAHAAVERAMRCEAPGRAERLALANVRQEQGRIDDAERALRALVRDYPDYPEAMGNLGGLLHDRATGLPPPAAAPLLDEAERWLARAVAAGPRRAEIQNSMGVLLHTRGRTAEAVPFLRRALELRPDFAEAARNLGIAWLVLDRPQDALAVLVPLLERSPGDPLLQQLVAAARERAQR